MLTNLFHTAVTVNDADVEQLSTPINGYTVEIHPPSNGDVPTTVDRLAHGILEIQSRRVFWNVSPVLVFELRRSRPDRLRLQYTASSKRLERKVRSFLAEELDGIGFADGVSGLPVAVGDTISGGILTAGRSDWFPLRTDFDRPPTNQLVALLHKHAMQDTNLIVQLLVQPVAGRPLRRWLWRWQGYKHRNYLRREKETLWGDISPTQREKQQARAVDTKLGAAQFRVSIRILLAGPREELVKSRLKELAGGFKVYENSDTGQYLDLWTVKSMFPQRIRRFANTVARRDFGGWSLPFRATPDEVAALLAVPSITQDNIHTAKP